MDLFSGAPKKANRCSPFSETQLTGSAGICPEDQDEVQMDCSYWGARGEVSLCPTDAL